MSRQFVELVANLASALFGFLQSIGYNVKRIHLIIFDGFFYIQYTSRNRGNEILRIFTHQPRFMSGF